MVEKIIMKVKLVFEGTARKPVGLRYSGPSRLIREQPWHIKRGNFRKSLSLDIPTQVGKFTFMKTSMQIIS